ncbi:MAG: carboxypeptidase regulatory-like domain-containing protein [Bryobacteraceae bacterium]|nr:carboxypeptidase regulatory-like domain-containing protein [Bryobacteraceae bacterium]
MWFLRRIPAIALSLALPMFADAPMTRLKVEVQTLGGKPVDRASVIVDFVEGRSIVKLGRKIMTHWEVRTSQEGLAKLPALPQGKMRVQVIAKGYQTFGQIYEVAEEDRTITVKLNPPQAQHSEHQ